METTKRAFLFGLVALVAAPTIVRASSLMQISAAPWRLPKLWGDGHHDDTAALNARLARADENEGIVILDGIYKITDTLVLTKSRTRIIGGTFLTHDMPRDRYFMAAAPDVFDCDLRNLHVEGGGGGGLFSIRPTA